MMALVEALRRVLGLLAVRADQHWTLQRFRVANLVAVIGKTSANSVAEDSVAMAPSLSGAVRIIFVFFTSFIPCSLQGISPCIGQRHSAVRRSVMGATPPAAIQDWN